jgi:CRP-like cAMP-binding protein
MAGSDHLEELSDVPLLAACSMRELQKVAKATDEVTVDTGTTLMAQGGLAREAFVVLEGTAEVTRDGTRLGVVGPGECVGELALLDPAPRSATVTALEPMRLLAIPAQRFTALLDDTPSLTRKLLSHLAARMHALDSSGRG